MIRSKRPFKPGDDAAPLWMISFSDMQAQLVVFFAMLFAFSNIDESKFQQMGASFAGSHGRNGAPPRDDFVVWYVMTHQIPGDSKELWGPGGREFEVRRTKEGLRISLERAIVFDEGSAQVHPEQIDAVRGFIRFIRGSLNKLDVRGYTSPNEAETDSDHWKLSASRAQAVADLLIAGSGETGIDPARIRVTGMGKNDPVVDILATRDATQWQRNRRVEILVLEEKVKLK